jgi:proteasome lid subunit RPN8/RPN11
MWMPLMQRAPSSIEPPFASAIESPLPLLFALLPQPPPFSMTDRMQRMFQQGAGARGAMAPPVDQAVAGPNREQGICSTASQTEFHMNCSLNCCFCSDTSETVHISSLALLKMLKHGRAGVPMEVMGLMLGEFVDEYSITVIDVFAMPQSGTGVSVEAVDPVFQTKMLDMLKQTNRPQMVVGWYHSHPGFGPWLSGVDMSVMRRVWSWGMDIGIV